MALKRAPTSWTRSPASSGKIALRFTFLLALFWAWVSMGGCSVWRFKQPATPVENRDYETLNAIVSEVLFEKTTDTYRLPMPRDAEGTNLFLSAIERLEAWRQRNPGQSDEILSIAYYTEGLCYEKLGQPLNALETYALVRSNDADLMSSVEERVARLGELLAFFPPENREAEGFTPSGNIEEAIETFTGTEWEPLAWILAENRVVREALEKRDSGGQVASTAYKDAIEGLIVQFSESRRVYEHWMRLGLYHENIAREWITMGEYGNNDKAWDLADKALQKASEVYLKVSQADGYPEKREAQAKLVTLEELSRKIELNLAE